MTFDRVRGRRNLVTIVQGFQQGTALVGTTRSACSYVGFRHTCEKTLTKVPFSGVLGGIELALVYGHVRLRATFLDLRFMRRGSREPVLQVNDEDPPPHGFKNLTIAMTENVLAFVTLAHGKMFGLTNGVASAPPRRYVSTPPSPASMDLSSTQLNP
ncbi:hypothetical protein CC78DRAFT_581784 [Lojkania enalia]|uniref:Uncharacterized protein n=1 Tax=Lojkania enalia TaxID=147567 RepID=A0A9P4K8H7_9PLEO|nr:hypothetical protein CC78DRAFT_581784 [Didymosphaeria enalia]